MKKQNNMEKREFTNQTWTRVLNEIWRYAPYRYGRGIHGYDESHPLVEKLKITVYELTMIMSFIEEQGLIEYDSAEHNWINLTLKGFDVALQNQSEKRATSVNSTSLFFSGAIAIFALVSVLVNIDDPFWKWAGSGMIMLALVAIGFVIKKV